MKHYGDVTKINGAEVERLREEQNELIKHREDELDIVYDLEKNSVFKIKTDGTGPCGEVVTGTGKCGPVSTGTAKRE